MKAIIRVVILVLALVVTDANAQEFQGLATYKTNRKVDIKMDSTKVNDELQKQMQAMLRKQFQKTFTLAFDRESSVYKEEESLAPPQVGGSGMQVMIVGSGGGGDILYKNTKEKRFSDQKDVYGKIFLVKDELKSYDWKLESETKNIGNYQCYKATFTREIEVVSDFSFSKNEKEDDKEEPKKEKKTIVTTAWYTTQIPVNNGPGNYHGLPGLILEINDGDQQIICTQVVINPEKKIDLSEPSKGKKIDKKAYDKIMEKKAKEMMERYAPRKGSREGEHFEIRIGG